MRVVLCIFVQFIIVVIVVVGQWADVRELNWCHFKPSREVVLAEAGEIQIIDTNKQNDSNERKEAITEEERDQVCSVQGYVRQDQTVVYKFWIPEILKEEEDLGIQLDFDMEVSLDVFQGDADISVYRAGFSAQQKPLTSSWFGAGHSVDQLFVSRYEFQRYPGEWRINITSYVQQSTFELRLNAIRTPRKLHPIDFLALSQIKSKCCAGTGTCPTIERAVNAYLAKYIPRDLCHTPPNWCDRHGHLVRFELDPLISDNLNCEFPAEFGYMVALRQLRMEFMLLRGSIQNVAQVVQLLPDLRALDVALNSFTGTLPCELVSPSMRMLMLVGNFLSGTIPPCFFEDAPELRELVVRENYLNGTLPPIRNDSKLAVLDVRAQKGAEKLRGPLPNVDQTLNNLVLFYAENNQFTGTLPAIQSTTMKEFGVSGNILVGQIPLEYTALKDLRYFNISNNYISGRVEEKLLYLSRLEILDVSNNLLTGSIPDNFRASSLQYLGLSNNYFIGRFPQSAARLAELAIIQAANNGFTGSLSPFMKNVPWKNRISQLQLQGNKLTGTLQRDLHKLCLFNNSEDMEGKMNRILRLDSNKIADTLPQLLIETIGDTSSNVIINISDNYINCPLFISHKVVHLKPLSQLTCLGPNLLELPLLQSITWNAEKQYFNTT